MIESNPMSPQLDHTIAEQAEAAKIILECAQKASGYPEIGRSLVQLTSPEQTRNFYRRVRKIAFDGDVEYIGTSEVLSLTVNGLEEYGAEELTITVDRNFTNIQGFPSGRKAADDTLESLDEAEERFAEKKKAARRGKMHIVR